MLPTLLRDPGFSLIVSQQGIHIKGYNNPGLAGSPRPRHGGLQSPNGTVTPVGTTLPCKALGFTEGFKPRHHVREQSQMFPHRPIKYKETHQSR
jgi:hypothetical protein